MLSKSLIKFDNLGDKRGSLISLEQNNNIPFNIKRIYYIFDTKEGEARGFHAHKNLEQVAVCVKGSVTFILDDGNSKEEFQLSSPDVGLYISGLKWREMHNFSDDCVVMVIASELYDESDYIRDYDEFLRCAK
ncbi:sugar 3,4-ketoisomerase [Pseudoalteromonas obscura]|uniref:FdtA/QdtA family cupin domain-containing protein n=1 Tax=Pseudoalteromonas obscura TaxID=3048491 RepID=A0ABT7ERF9_9GAMM|nr:FdtA/QdtA family cupin domain-containing protein [Pseudoalteromonas sp. P94(2023)]MDK2597603.1 FdtA/QdtA family cupin domain-containing protein [Pseudoalteromonas sp. P94(2023)]